MQVMRRVRITGTGMYVPPRVVTNKDLEGLMDTTDEWIQQRTGVKERRHVEPGVGPSEMGYYATLQALEMAGLEGDVSAELELHRAVLDRDLACFREIGLFHGLSQADQQHLFRTAVSSGVVLALRG